jgi:hypothetical protein
MAEDMKELKFDELENISGGALEIDPGPFYQHRYIFTKEEVEILKNNGIYGIEADQLYNRSALNEKGIPGDNASAIRESLNAWGIQTKLV